MCVLKAVVVLLSMLESCEAAGLNPGCVRKDIGVKNIVQFSCKFFQCGGDHRRRKPPKQHMYVFMITDVEQVSCGITFMTLQQQQQKMLAATLKLTYLKPDVFFQSVEFVV